MERKIVLSAGYFHAFHRIGPLVSLKRGYFKQEGLDHVEVVASGKDELTIDGLKNGKIDFGLDVKPRLVCTENSKGERLYIIGSMINDLPLSLISVKEAKTIADLKGKRIRVVEDGRGRDAVWIRSLLRDNGLDPDKEVTFVTGYGASLLQDNGLRPDGGYDHASAVSGWLPRPQIFEQIASAGFNHLAERSDTCPGGYPDRVLVTTGDMLEQHPQRVKGFLKAMIRGYRFAMDEKNQSELTQIVTSYKWEKEMGYDDFHPASRGSFSRAAKFLSHDCSVRGLDIVIREEKASAMLPEAFTMEQVARFEFQKQAAKEIDAKFDSGGYE